MQNSVKCFINGQLREISDGRVFSTLSDYLRYDLGLIGTKVVCAEGDCGSCSVLVGRCTGERIEYATVCSCIQFVFQLHGAHVVTIEGANRGNSLNVFQESMAKCHGAQCGFCTPGIVMAVAGLRERVDDGASIDGRDALIGNLCRCTGYEAIVRACEETQVAKLQRMAALYPDAELLPTMRELEASPVRLQVGERLLYRPTTLEQAAAFRAEHPDAIIVSGATDVGVQVNKLGRPLNKVLSLSGVTELKRSHADGGEMVIGAGVSLAEFELKLKGFVEPFAELMHYFGSPPIKAAGSIGGNIGTGSPIGDTLPALLALDAELELVSMSGRRRVKINEFYVGYRKTIGRPDELIAKVIIPQPAMGETLKLYKISRRRDLDISAFAAAFLLKVENNRITSVRIAFGGVGPTVVRLPKTEAFLKDRPLELATFEEAGAIARSEVKPISDVRGSMQYRQQLAENIFCRLYYDLTSGVEALA